MRTLDQLTNRELVRRYRQLNAKHTKLVNALCDAGLGDLTPTKMRKRLCEQDCPKIVREYLDCIEKSSGISLEATRRYGPDLITVEQLIWKTK